jgi:hypothetical protein
MSQVPGTWIGLLLVIRIGPHSIYRTLGRFTTQGCVSLCFVQKSPLTNLQSFSDTITGFPNCLEVDAGEPSPAVPSIPEIVDSASIMLSCRLCDQKFSGTLAHTNYNRHITSQHGPDTTSLVVCTECSKSFERADALLKHKREKHPQLGRAPAIRRKKGQLETFPPPPANEEPQYKHSVEIKENPRISYPALVENRIQKPATDKGRTFDPQKSPRGYHPHHITTDSPSTLHDLVISLEPKIRGHFCSTFFSHWADILEELRYRGYVYY